MRTHLAQFRLSLSDLAVDVLELVSDSIQLRLACTLLTIPHQRCHGVQGSENGRTKSSRATECADSRRVISARSTSVSFPRGLDLPSSRSWLMKLSRARVRPIRHHTSVYGHDRIPQ